MDRRRHLWRSAAVAAAGLTLAAAGAVSPARAGEYKGAVNVVLGQKFMNEHDWEPVEDPFGGIVEMTWGDTDWPIGLATDVGYWTASDSISGLDVDGGTAEVAIGVREIRNTEKFYYYVGLGFNLIRAEVTLKASSNDDTDDDTGIGGWGGAGIYWRMGSHFNLGISARYAATKVTLFDEDVQAGGFSYGILMGYGWPATK